MSFDYSYLLNGHGGLNELGKGCERCKFNKRGQGANPGCKSLKKIQEILINVEEEICQRRGAKYEEKQ